VGQRRHATLIADTRAFGGYLFSVAVGSATRYVRFGLTPLVCNRPVRISGQIKPLFSSPTATSPPVFGSTCSFVFHCVTRLGPHLSVAGAYRKEEEDQEEEEEETGFIC